MTGKKVKISKGLKRLLQNKAACHFQNAKDIFLDNPTDRSGYLQQFQLAQIVDIAQGSSGS